MRYACSRLLAGIILMDTSNGRAVIVNSIEVFGRRRSLDAHRESFRVKKETMAPTSLPPETTRYRNVWPTSYNDVDGLKLVIGTKIFSALVASSLRIDIDNKPDIGPVTSNIILNTYERAYYVIFQLRQLRTRFHKQSTYFACRGFNEPTDDISTRPYTVITLCEWDNGNNDTGYRLGSLLLQKIANSNVLQKDDVNNLKLKIAKGIDMEKLFNEAIALYNNDDCIVIIDNTDLNLDIREPKSRRI
ncbi:hypothetical protein DM01DRAFT_1364442 [Hesseltinella vesiculosa]|uniref:Uncharacterized protein n=1 Tax=Hesseltinella vesiculosa TaxID=101127 RepID=A0A1X2G6F9_9FUNG|nr:hypothetical protein DM01DRAFT_1364442 [Hesseltinella vesiculosa]